MIRRLALVVCFNVACNSGGGSATPNRPPPPGPQPLAMPGPAAPPAAPLSRDLVVIEVSGAASRSGTSARALRRIVAARQGFVELAQGYTQVGLTVSKVVSGPIDDPSYATRPVGTNHLEVVLTDEAAFAAGSSMDGFAGTWKLTKLADGTLVASAIEDTPYPRDAVAQRRAMIVQARRDLRAPLPEQRLAGLDVLAQHAFYELVPDVIALLDDGRSDNAPIVPPSHAGRGPRVVGDAAEATLRKLVAPLGDDGVPTTGAADAWATYWKDLVTRIPTPPALAPTTRVEVAKLAMNQSWPDVVPTEHGGFVLGVSRLETAIDGHADGLFVMPPPYTQRTWITTVAVEGVEAAVGRVGIGVAHGSYTGPWQFTVVPSQPGRAAKTTTLTAMGRAASHCAVAASDEGFLVVSIAETARSLRALPLDPLGKPRGKPRTLVLPSAPAASYHRGVHPVALARRAGGWLAALETEAGVIVANVDESLALVGTQRLADNTGISQPKLAVSRDRAMVVWTVDSHAPHLAAAIIDLTGKPVGAITTAGSEVSLVSTPVALDDGGFAVAWLEAGNEVHVGRWDRTGTRIAAVTVAARDASQFGFTLSRDGNAVLVTYEDTARYPYTLVARRLELALLR